jgi:hypothetical protein
LESLSCETEVVGGQKEAGGMGRGKDRVYKAQIFAVSKSVNLNQ